MKYRILIIGALLSICLISGCGKSPIIPQKVLESAVKKEIGIAVEKQYPDYRKLKLESVKSVNAFAFHPHEAQCGYIAVVSFLAKNMDKPMSWWSSERIKEYKQKQGQRVYYFANVEGTLNFLSSQGRWKCDRVKAPVVTKVTRESDKRYPY